MKSCALSRYLVVLLASALSTFLFGSIISEVCEGRLLYHVQGELVVKFKERYHSISSGTVREGYSTGFNEIDETLSRFGIKRIERQFKNAELFPRGPEDLSLYFKISFPEERDLYRMMDELLEGVCFEKVEPIGVYEVSIVPNDSLFSTQIGLGDARYRDIDAPEGWDVVRGDTTPVIAIIDTGVDWHHPDLSQAIWINWREMNGSPGIDDDLNGYIDDIRGWDWIDGVSAYPGEDRDVEDNDPMDFNGHGTIVAGIAGAATDNRRGIAGVGWGSRIMALRAGWSTPYNGSEVGVVRMDFCAQAIYYAAVMGANIINASWSSGEEGGIEVSMGYAVSQGVLVVVAAGNNNSSSQVSNYLSTRGDCLDVAALSMYDCKRSDSNYGSWVDVSAPGEYIQSTYFNHNAQTHTYIWKSGTSMAAPFAAGLAGLLKSQHPDWTGTQIMTRMVDTADDLGDPGACWRTDLGSGRINAFRALKPGTGFWKGETKAAVESSPAVSDVDRDGEEEVAVGSNDSLCYLFSKDGSLEPGWPVRVSGMVKSPPSIGNLDGDSFLEIALGTADGKVYVFKYDGTFLTGWPVQVGGAVSGSCVLSDVSGDSILEVVACAGESLYVFGQNGSRLAGWRVGMGNVLSGTPSIGDIDGDGTPDIVVGGMDGSVHALKRDGSPFPGWPRLTGGAVFSSTCLADVDGDSLLDVIAASEDSMLYVWNHAGLLLSGWPSSTGGKIRSSPSVSDLNRDGSPEVLVGSLDGKVYCFSNDGTLSPGWPVLTGGEIKSSPAIFDVDSDGRSEVFFGSSDWRLYGLRFDGSPIPGWPKGASSEVTSSPSIADLNRDGVVEVIVGSLDKRLHVFDTGSAEFSSSLGDWPTFHQNPRRTGVYPLKQTTSISRPDKSETSVAGLSARLLGSSPNPFSTGTTLKIALELTRGAGASLERAAVGLSIFDVQGKIVRILEIQAAQPGVKSLYWDGKDSAGKPLPSGVYLVSINGKRRVSGKVVLLR